MQRTRPIVTQLEQDIEQIVDNRGLNIDQKIRRIFQLRKPEDETITEKKGLNSWLDQGEWAILKIDRDFWLGIIHKLGFIDVEATNEAGNKMFSFPEVAQILGDNMAFRIMQEGNAFDLPAFEQQIYAKKQFMDYMLWYDETASMNFLVLYGRYLALQDQLVEVEKTREHRPAIIARPSIEVTKELAYNVVSQLKLVVSNTVHNYFFFQKKVAENEMDVLQPFVIKSGQSTKEISTNGPILSVLKFFYPKANFTGGNIRGDTVFIVISGAQDKKLLRFNHLNVMDVLVVDHFFIDSEDFDDLVYASDVQPSRFATNAKSARTLEDLKIIDLSKFSTMLIQKIRRPGDITKEERRKLVEQRARGSNKGDEGYLDIQTDYDYGKLLTRLAEPIVVRFKTGQSSYTVGEVELLAVKLIRVPAETQELQAHLATLVRVYTNNEGNFELQLRLYRYQATTIGQFTSFSSRIFPLQQFLTPNTDLFAYVVQEMNIIFHSASIFYIEVMQRKTFLEHDEFLFTNSQLLEFDFKYGIIQNVQAALPQPAIVIDGIRDIAIFEQIRINNFKVYDYRHDHTPMGFSKYDAIFYKYNLTKATGRVIFYKANIANDVNPSVGDRQIYELKPRHIINFVSLPNYPNLAFMTFKTEELQETNEGTFRIVTLETPEIVRFTVDVNLQPYDPTTFSLAANFTKKMTIASETINLKCTFCGDRAHIKHNKTNTLYCDNLCHTLSTESYRL